MEHLDNNQPNFREVGSILFKKVPQRMSHLYVFESAKPEFSIASYPPNFILRLTSCGNRPKFAKKKKKNFADRNQYNNRLAIEMLCTNMDQQTMMSVNVKDKTIYLYRLSVLTVKSYPPSPDDLIGEYNCLRNYILAPGNLGYLYTP